MLGLPIPLSRYRLTQRIARGSDLGSAVEPPTRYPAIGASCRRDDAQGLICDGVFEPKREAGYLVDAALQ